MMYTSTKAVTDHQPQEGRFAPYLCTGIGVIALLAVAIGGWAATTSLAGAVLSEGKVVVRSNVKTIQHPYGGTVRTIHVRNGDRVKAGDTLIRLDEEVTRANLTVITKQLDELTVRRARLTAERDGSAAIKYPAALKARSASAELKALMTVERKLFESRAASRNGRRAQLRERMTQFNEEITGLKAQLRANAHEIDLVAKELAGLEKLRRKRLVRTRRLMAMRRTASRLTGERARLKASIAKSKGQIAEIRLQVIQIDQDFRTEVVGELRQVQVQEAQLVEKRVAAQDRHTRIEVRAPVAGIVHELKVHTIGGVIQPGAPILQLVPDDDRLVIDAMIAPQDIDRLHPGQIAFIRFPAFNQRTTPEVSGRVQRIAPELTRDPVTNLAYYVARITLSAAERKRLGNARLVPGMPAEVHVRTEERTALSYLIKPLQDQIARAFKER